MHACNRLQVKVNSTQIVVTYDEPESGFDALLQAMVCKEQIGWRERTRRLVVFATDAPSHLAGHGRVLHSPSITYCNKIALKEWVYVVGGDHQAE